MVSKCFKMFRRINSISKKRQKNARNFIIFTIRKYYRNYLKLCLERSRVEHYGRSCDRSILFDHVTSCMRCKTGDSINFNIILNVDNDTGIIYCPGITEHEHLYVICSVRSVRSQRKYEVKLAQMRSHGYKEF